MVTSVIAYQAEREHARPAGAVARTPRSYWVLAAALGAYVALCTGSRENHPRADAWEHHRAIAVLAREGPSAGNPTYASDAPSVRYSPYTLALAGIARASGLDPWDVQSGAAVFNTALLAIALAALLGGLGESAAATPALLAMVLLWGGPPGHAGSTALSDLPWHQVNPSAFALALALLAAAGFWRALAAPRPLPWIAGVAALTALAALSHGMVAAWLALWLLAFAALTPRAARLRAFGLAGAALAAALLLCLAWPLYDFRATLLGPLASASFYNPGVARRFVFEFTLPALAAASLALPLRGRPVVAASLAVGAVSWTLGVLALPFDAATLARMGLHSAQAFQIAVGVWASQAGILRGSAWRRRLRRAALQDGRHSGAAIAEIVLVGLVLFVTAPQLLSIAREPWLARAYFAPWIGAADQSLHLRERLAAALAPVGPHDVVLAGQVTAWPVPSVRGRIVSALHPELFVPGQEERARDVAAFFGAQRADRAAILARWNVRWILLDRSVQSASEIARLLDPSVVVRDVRGFVLMDARGWRQPGS